MGVVAFEWTWTNILLVLVGYVSLIRLLRYRGRDTLYKKYGFNGRESLKGMTTDQAWEIQKYLASREFPLMIEKAIQFALFRYLNSPEPWSGS